MKGEREMAKRAKKSAVAVPVGPMLDRAVAALKRTWNAIGYDCLAAGGRNPERTVMSAEDVRDCVGACGFATGYPADYGRDPEAVEWLEGLGYEEADAVLALAFPKGRYGM